METNFATARVYGGQSGADVVPRESVIANLNRSAEALNAGIEELERRLTPVLSPDTPVLASGNKPDVCNDLRAVAGRFEAAHGRLSRLIARVDL